MAIFAPLFDANLATQIHLASVMLAVLLAPLQMLRARRDHWHKRIGYVWAGAMVIAALALSGCQGEGPSDISPSDIATIGDKEIADANRTADWLAYGKTHSETRFSPLTDINGITVSKLPNDKPDHSPIALAVMAVPVNDLPYDRMYFPESRQHVRPLSPNGPALRYLTEEPE